LLALRGGDVAKVEAAGRDGCRQAPGAAAARCRLIEPAAITGRENGTVAPEDVKNLAIAPSLAPVQTPPLAMAPTQRDQPIDSEAAFCGGSPMLEGGSCP
jgi:hypothetical protein